MDDTLLFIPPCCVDKKLPKAVTQAPHRNLIFYTHGDVTMEKFYRAVSYLLVNPHVMVLSMANVSDDTFVFLQQCFERKWITHLILSTARNLHLQVARYLADYSSRILYCCKPDVSPTTSHLVLYNRDRALTINGLMTDRPVNSTLEGYNMTFYPLYSLFDNSHEWGNPLRNILFPDVLRHRQAYLSEPPADPTLKAFLYFSFPSSEDDTDEEPNNDHYSFSNI